MGYKFLSDEWFTKVDELRDAAGDLDVPDTIKEILLNVTVTDDDGEKKMHMKEGVFERGHAEAAQTTLTLPDEIARKIFIENDAQAGMQAFMAGQIKVEGDMTKVMALQTVAPSDAQKTLLRQIKEITEA